MATGLDITAKRSCLADVAYSGPESQRDQLLPEGNFGRRPAGPPAST
jgi:hypothetical protein